MPKKNAAAVKDRIVGLRRIRAKDLRPHPKNWRKHPDRQRSAVRQVLEDVGYVGALIARELPGGKYELIDGHLRRGLTPDEKVPVLVVDVSANEALKVLGTYDPIGDLARADKDRLKDALQRVRARDQETVDLLRYLGDRAGVDIRKAGVRDPGAQRPPKKPRTRPGDLWTLGRHRLLCGDATRAEDLARLMGSEKAALLSTDPPYCVDYTGNDRPEKSGKDWRHVYREIDIKDLGEFLDRVFAACLPRLAPDAAIYLWHADIQQPVISDVFRRHDIRLHQVIVWVKPSATYSHSYYRWRHEPCVFGWRRGGKPPHGAGKLDTVWEVDWEGKRRLVGNEHPTQKPVRLFEIPMEQHTEADAVCLEPFSGSGSQIIAAENLGRRCFALEIQPAFVDAAVRRWEKATGEKATLERSCRRRKGPSAPRKKSKKPGKRSSTGSSRAGSTRAR